MVAALPQVKIIGRFVPLFMNTQSMDFFACHISAGASWTISAVTEPAGRRHDTYSTAF